MDNRINNRISQPHQKKKVSVTRDFMPNRISKKGLNRAHSLGELINQKVTNFPGGTSDKIAEKIDDLIKNKPVNKSNICLGLF